MNKIKNCIKYISEKKWLYTAMIFTAVFLVIPSDSVHADKLEQAANSASKGIQGSASGMLASIVAIVIVIAGFILIFGGERGKDTVKFKAGAVLIAIALILFAIPLTKVLIGWFN